MSTRRPDFYAVLQVAPDAEREVIDAAYRQLMRKYHPDVAQGDEALARQLHERAKAINQAYAVLRDTQQRQAYDQMRQRAHFSSAAQSAGPTSAGAAGAAPSNAATRQWQVPLEHLEQQSWWLAEAPMNVLASVYYLLPGPYEWESAARRERLFTALIPPLGLLCWLATIGALNAVLGPSPYAVAVVWLVCLVVLAIADWRSLPRLAVGGGLVLGTASGALDAAVASAGIPIWLVWTAVSGACMLLAARATAFGVLPTIALCWLIGLLR